MRRHPSFFIVPVAAVSLFSCQPPSGISSPGVDAALACIRPEAIRAHIRFLADDLLEGREAGTRGFDLAAKYVASAFESMGFEPAGLNETYFQEVAFRTGVVDFGQSSLTLIRDAWKKDLEIGKDYILSADFQRESVQLRAPLVFVGFGISAPELNYDDYAGVNAEGKIAVMLHGAPATFPNSQRAHYSGWPKLENAVAHGAVGVLNILLAEDEKRIPWSMVAENAREPGMKWTDAAGRPRPVWPEIRGVGLLSRETAEEIFAYAPISLPEVFSHAEAGKLRGFDIPLEAEMVTVTHHGEAQSPNVIAKLPGTDPRLRDEYLVYSAHLDHDGIKEAMDGDNIFNGAYDNASGTAVLLEIARAFKCLPDAPKRSILFLVTTAEEKGLLGADYFARHPTVPRESLVADINLDMALMLYPIRDLVVFGAEHSSLGETYRQVADHMGLDLSPDPMPEEVLFVRSDQYPFVRQGIPAAFTIVGLQSGDPDVDGAAAIQDWLATVYHTPKDDFSQDMNFQTGTTYAGVNLLAGYLVAQASERPAWNEGDFFGAEFGGQEENSKR